MSDREDFLSRWSRRKRDADKESLPNEENKQILSAELAPPEADAPASTDEENAAEPAAKVETAEEKEKGGSAFDLSKLPSLESITADTDIRPFLAAGVPANLRQAALRRVWVADPGIRDFIGIAENQWDFTAGGDAPGFDFSPPTGDVKRMVSEIFGGSRPEQIGKSESEDKLSEQEEPKSVRRAESAQHVEAYQFGVRDGAEEAGLTTEAAADEAQPAQVPETAVQSEDVASQNIDAKQSEIVHVRSRRPHGGAMPK
jgi:hypothetical protein